MTVAPAFVSSAGMNARLDALDAEAVETKRFEAAQDRATALADPATGAMTTFGLPAARTDLIAGLAFAGVLDCLPVSPGCSHCARWQCVDADADLTHLPKFA